MTRQDEIDRKVIGNCAGLRFLVLDELHTYRGRQGADVALLVRRVRERLSPEHLQCIGTSATMASEGSLEDKSRVVASVASKLFAADDPGEQRHRRDPRAGHRSRRRPPSRFADALGRGHRRRDPVEHLRRRARGRIRSPSGSRRRLGISWSEVDQRWVRARPLTVTEASSAGGGFRARPEPACQRALRELLLVSSAARDGADRRPDGERPELLRVQAAPVHLRRRPRLRDARGARAAHGHRRRAAVPARRRRRSGSTRCTSAATAATSTTRSGSSTEGGDRRFLARDIDDAPPKRPEDDADAAGDAEDDEPTARSSASSRPTPRTPDFTFADRDEDYPETWLEFDAAGNPRLKSHYREARARSR